MTIQHSFPQGNNCNTCAILSEIANTFPSLLNTHDIASLMHVLCEKHHGTGHDSIAKDSDIRFGSWKLPKDID